MLELLSGYNQVLPFLAHTLRLVFLAETEQESMAKCGVFAVDLGTDAMTMNRKVFLALHLVMQD